MERSQFTFYGTYWETIKCLPKLKRLQVLEELIWYSLTGEVKTQSKTAHQIFMRLKPQLDAEIRVSSEGRRSSEYKNWRTSVYERDNYTCVICGARGVRLNAHHIKSYAGYPDLRYSLPNGITLCEDCHKLVHKMKRNGW